MDIINAKIYTMNGEIIENGFVTIENKTIKKVGPMTTYTGTSEEVIDIEGKILMPGMIDAHCHIGMFEDSIGFEGDDGNEDTDPTTPHLRAIDAINPLDRCFNEALDAGITTVITGPGSANPISGQIAAMKTYGRRIDDMIIAAPIGMKFAFGENPKSTYHSKNQAPVTRMATAAIIRDQLKKAKRYMEDILKAETDEDYDLPEYDIKCEALIPLLKRELKAHIHAHRADDIFTAIRICKEFNLDYVLIHCTEGHLIAKELGEENAKAVIGPIICDRSKPELRNLTPKNGKALDDCNVHFSICTDHPVIPIQYLPICAAACVKEGLDYREALKSVTSHAAEICGLDYKVGKIKEGLDADLLVFSADPLSVYSKPEMVFVNGERVR